MYRGKISDKLMIAANQKLKERDYWLDQLSGELDKVFFHYHKPAADRETGEYAYQTLTFSFEDHLWQQLLKLSNNADFRLHMILVAAVVALLHKYTGNPDIIVGSPIYKQEQDIEFINTVLPLRHRVEPGISFKALLLKVRQVVVRAVEHQNYPIEILVEKLGLHTPENESTGSDFPLYDVMVVVENIHDKKYIRRTPTNTVFSFLRKEDSLQGELIYNTHRYDASKIRSIVTHLTCLLREVLSGIDLPLSGVVILSPEEKKQILFQFNDTKKDFHRDKCYHRLFEEQVARSPHGIAAQDSYGQISYCYLNERAHQAAGVLIRSGLKENDIAAIHMNRSIAMLVAILAVFKAGGAYLGIDADYPETRVQTILEDSESYALITETGNLTGARQLKSRLPRLHTVLGLGAETEVDPGGVKPGLEVSPDSLAYIIYTSGTTGKPKGVMIHHLGMLNHIYANTAFLGLSQRDIIAQTASLSFDISVWQFLTAIILGGLTYIIDSEAILDTQRFIRILQSGRISILEVVPSLMKSFLERIEQEGYRELPALRWMIPTGEALSVALARQWYRHYPRVKLVNAYGPAEASDDVTLWVIDAPALETQSLIPIGKPLQNLHIYIMDTHLSLCPVNVPGEICIAGIGVGKGYLKDPEKTGASFVPNPYIDEIGDRDYAILYKTGDMGFFQEDGNVIFLGRKDHQVKVRGFRIELEEIENQLLTMSGINETVVVAKGESSDRYLCAYIVPAPDQRAELSVSGVRDYLAVRLPYYMVPPYCIFLDQLPLTPNGKLDRKALPDPEVKAGDRYIAPRNKMEATLAEICAEILEIDQGIIGIDADFFELGGHSLKAVLLVAKIHKIFDVKIPLAEIFNLQTIRAFAAYIGKEAKDRYQSIAAAEKRDFYVMSSAQRRLYILQQLDPQSTVYNMPQVIVVEMAVEKEKLEATFRRLIRRHESLRASFVMLESEAVQWVMEPGAVAFDIQYEDHRDRESEVDEIIGNFIRPFDLSGAPLLRVGLFRTRERRYVLIVDLHHIISDGISHSILTQEFIAFYTSLHITGEKGEEPPPLRVQYKDYSQWRQRQRQEEVYKRLEAFWLGEFDLQVPLLSMPADYARPVQQSFAGDHIAFELGKQETRQLNQIARTHDTTLFMTLLAVYYLFLFKVTCQEDIVVGTPVAGRAHTELQQIIGIFINTLPLRNFPAAGKTFSGFLGQVKARTLEAFENQDYPFEELVEKVVTQRDLSRNPLFDTMFMLQNFAEPAPASGPGSGPGETADESKRVSIENYIPTINSAKFDLTLSAIEAEEQLYFSFEYCTDLFKKETVTRFIRYFKQVVAAVAAAPGCRLGEIAVLSEEEKRRIVVDFNDTAAEFADRKLFHQLFEAQAERFPDHIALLGQGEPGTGARTALAPGAGAGRIAVTYRELNRRAQGLALRLKEKQVCPDTLVALLVDRTLAMMTGILAVSKAGGAYLPLDPEYPPERTAYILEDSGISLLLTGTGLNLPEGIPARAEVIEINDGTPFGQESGQDLEIDAKSTDLAYVIYTSGSTGKPKGVMIRHVNLVNFIRGMMDIFDFTPGDRILSLTTISFDIFALETILPLTAGSRVIIGTAAEQIDVEAAAATMVREGVTLLQVTPSRLTMLTANPGSASALAALNYLLVGGEAFPESLLTKTREVRPGKIHNMFGPTETTVWSTVKDVTRGESLNIGKPIANTGIYILDREYSLLPLGTAGELCISGAGLARGYINNPELTSERFVELKQAPGETYRSNRSSRSYIYLTGDLARWLPDGNIEFLGRQDDQVKIRGFRIELAEIESQLATHEDIRETVVVCRGEVGGDKYICAYFVPGKPGSIAGDTAYVELREFLVRKLPAYMIPSYFIPIDQIPLTPNGKVDRKALPQPEIKAGEGYTAPRDQLEQKMTELWAEVLGAHTLPESIGIDDHFFHLGGNSLNGTVLITKIHRELEVQLPLTEIFKFPTIRGLATVIRGLTRQRYQSIDPAEKKEYYAITSAQRRFYILQQMDPENTGFNISEVFVLEEKRDHERIAGVFRQLLKRHGIFRMSFEMIGGEPFQRIRDRLETGIEVHRGKEPASSPGAIPDVPAGEPDRAAGDDIPAEADAAVRGFIRPFDLSQAPLIRVGVIDIRENKHILMIDLHHIVMDGLSMGVLLQEFLELYLGNSLPSLRIQYRDFSEWQNSESVQRLIKSQEKYWLKIFGEGVPVLNLPTDFARPAVQSFAGEGVGFEIGTGETIGLKQLAREAETTLYMVILAIFNILLSKVCGQDAIPVGTGGAGRRHQDLLQMLGTFQNMVVLINYPTAGKTFRQFLEEVKQRTLEAFENQDYQFEELVKKVSRARDASRNPLFDVFLILNNMDMVTSGPGQEQGSAVNSQRYFPPVTRTRFDLGLYGNEGRDTLVFFFEYCSKLFKKETIDAFIGYIHTIISRVVENDDVPIAEIKISHALTESRDDFSRDDYMDFTF